MGLNDDIAIQVSSRTIREDDTYSVSGAFRGEILVSNDLVNWKLLGTDLSCFNNDHFGEGQCGTYHLDLNDHNLEALDMSKFILLTL